MWNIAACNINMTFGENIVNESIINLKKSISGDFSLQNGNGLIASVNNSILRALM